MHNRFGSFLPSLWSSSNQVYSGRRSRHCYANQVRQSDIRPRTTCPVTRQTRHEATFAVPQFENMNEDSTVELRVWLLGDGTDLFTANESRQHRGRPFPVKCTQFFGCNDARFKVIGTMFEDHAAQSEAKMRNVIFAINITLDGCCDHTKNDCASLLETVTERSATAAQLAPVRRGQQ